jgi:hypothetical protein
MGFIGSWRIVDKEDKKMLKILFTIYKKYAIMNQGGTNAAEI